MQGDFLYYCMQPLQLKKQALRAKMIALRLALPEKTREAMSLAIAGHVFGLPEIVKAHHIHLYLSMHTHAEVDTAPLIEGLAAMGKEMSVPAIRDGKLFSAAFRQSDPVLLAQFGQPEPQELSIVDDSLLDVMLIPLLAFDGKGIRLGYGKGFYDFFLQRLSQSGKRPSRIGLSFSQQMVDELPADPWDEALDTVVHEAGIIRFT